MSQKPNATLYYCQRNVYIIPATPAEKIIGYFSVWLEDSGPCLTWIPYNMLPDFDPTRSGKVTKYNRKKKCEKN